MTTQKRNCYMCDAPIEIKRVLIGSKKETGTRISRMTSKDGKFYIDHWVCNKCADMIFNNVLENMKNPKEDKK